MRTLRVTLAALALAVAVAPAASAGNQCKVHLHPDPVTGLPTPSLVC